MGLVASFLSQASLRQICAQCAVGAISVTDLKGAEGVGVIDHGGTGSTLNLKPYISRPRTLYSKP